jgi:D-tyrosyl-tRNA(Tyr) deacylase
LKAVIQRVTSASVSVEESVIGSIEKGLCVLLGVTHADTESDAEWIVNKIIGMRIFEDSEGKLNRSLIDVEGSVLLISQFTLYGDCRKGRRPSFVKAARPEMANVLYEHCRDLFIKKGVHVETGKFQSYMQVSINNDGPVTLVIDSPGSED